MPHTLTKSTRTISSRRWQAADGSSGKATSPKPAAAMLDLAQQVACLLQVHREAGSFLESARDLDLTSSPSTSLQSERPGTPDRPLQAARAARRRRHGQRLRGRAGTARPPQGGAQDHQARHGQPPGARPLRGRAAGAGADGPSATSPRCSTRARPTAAGPTS